MPGITFCDVLTSWLPYEENEQLTNKANQNPIWEGHFDPFNNALFPMDFITVCEREAARSCSPMPREGQMSTLRERGG